jgi:hypothetical protein
MANLTAFQRGAYFFGIMLFNQLAINIKKKYLMKQNYSNVLLKRFLLLHSFYSIQEYFNYNNKYNLGLIII